MSAAEHPRRTAVAAAAGRRLRADRARLLADLLRREVLGSGYPDGVLPHEDRLAAEYGATRNAVRQALDLLRGEGLITRVPGVALLDCDLERSDVFRLPAQLTGQPLGTAEIALEAVNADAVLEAPLGAALLMLERLTHLADGRPVDPEFIRFRGDRITMTGALRRGGEPPLVARLHVDLERQAAAAVRTALTTAPTDADADVRGYARRALDANA